jgi:two-component system response regulator MprA
MRLLVVEDDPKISRFLLKGLGEEDHFVELVEDGAAAVDRATLESYDAILLDVLLPTIDGFEACRLIRASGVDTPILMLTARDAVADRVQGLDAGADDYIVKPFAFDELLARLRALLRRGRTAHSSSVLRCGPLEVDTEAHRASMAGQEISLTATEYRLLEFLVRRAGAIVSREQIADHVWGGDYDPFSNLSDVYVSYLRRKLESGGSVRLIHTVRGLGYTLKAEREGDPP